MSCVNNLFINHNNNMIINIYQGRMDEIVIAQMGNIIGSQLQHN